MQTGSQFARVTYPDSTGMLPEIPLVRWHWNIFLTPPHPLSFIETDRWEGLGWNDRQLRTQGHWLSEALSDGLVVCVALVTYNLFRCWINTSNIKLWTLKKKNPLKV